MNLLPKQKDTDTEHKLTATKGESGGGGECIGNLGYMLLHIKQKNGKDMLQSTEDCIQCLAITYNRKENEKEYMYI